MTKIVNVQATIPVRTLSYPIYGVVRNIEMEVGDIFRCICGRAFVDEVLSDGTLLRLGFDNYNKDNEPVASTPVVEETPVEEVIVTPPVEEVVEAPVEVAPVAAPVEVPVVDETPVAIEAEVVADEEAIPDTTPIVEEVQYKTSKK